MIVDHLSNIEKYRGISPNFDLAIDYIKTHQLIDIDLGRTEISGQNLYLLRDSYVPKGIHSCYFEGHKNYADIQIVLKGYEYIGYCYKGSSGVTVKTPYQQDKDVEKYEIIDFTKVFLHEQMFVIVFPDDLHMPKLAKDFGIQVEKAVFKVKLE
jgi:YhcH/YjgK/YiaL family protein